jgi:hypothetical protein
MDASSSLEKVYCDREAKTSFSMIVAICGQLMPVMPAWVQ